MKFFGRIMNPYLEATLGFIGGGGGGILHPPHPPPPPSMI